MSTSRLPAAVTSFAYRWLAETEADGEVHSEFGVHIAYEDLYDFVVFLTCIYLAGHIATYCKMPGLVGEIIVGIVLGPPLADFVPNPEAWVLLGEVGLVILVLEAGIDIDVSTLKLIGTRGFLIAFVGSVLPIGIGILLAILVNGTDDIKAAIAAGATFGPTSLGIALNILRSGGILNTPVGQLIISAAVIDDMIALIVLSQLESLAGTIDAAGILIPIVSAVLFLVVGGYLALFVAPPFLNQYVLKHFEQESHGKIEMAVMFGILLALMPATFYAKASYLMGAFVAGLAFCTSHELHETFVRQFKRLLQWLMRIFFAASIGFQVPIKDLFQHHVLWKGLVFTLALTGKLAVGFMVPNFTQSKSFTGIHLRDCLITGFSMAAEGEFAFVIAVFAVDKGLIDKDLYASVVLAVLISTIIPPFLLRFTISHYNKKAEEAIKALANAEMERQHDLEHELEDVVMGDDHLARLEDEIKSHRAVFLCIQTQSEARWGLMHNMMKAIAKLGLDIIDHRSWHPRGIHSTLVNEVYVKDQFEKTAKGQAQQALDTRIQEIHDALEDTIDQKETARVKVQRWYPGVVEEIVESVHERKRHGRTKINLEERLLSEASKALDRRQSAQVLATKEKTVEEILAGMQKDTEGMPVIEEHKAGPIPQEHKKQQSRRRRQKMRSTPVVGGGLFDKREVQEEKEEAPPSKSGSGQWTPTFDFKVPGHKAEIIVKGESYDIRINDATLKKLRSGFSGDMLDHRGVSASEGVSIQPDRSNVVNNLHGYVRNPQLGKIVEETIVDSESETSSVSHQNVTNPHDPPV